LVEKVTAAVSTAPRRIEIREFEKPRLKSKDFLMKIRYCGVCGSDIHLWKGNWKPPFPLILGHEFIGEVAEVGSEVLEWRGLKEGDQVAVEMIIPCHKCKWCLRGYYNLCETDDRSISHENGAQYGCSIPITRPPTALWGGYSQYLYVPKNALVHKLEKQIDWRVGALVEPLAVSVRAVKRGEIRVKESVAVLGPGTIGLLAVVAAKAAGAEPIILTGTRDSRLDIGEALGADATINIKKVREPVKEVRRLLGGSGADVVIEAAGTPSAQAQSFKVARRGGRIVLVGLTGGMDLTVNPDLELLPCELDIRPSYLSAHAYQNAIKIIQSGRFDLEKIVTHIYPLREVDEAFERFMSKEGDAVKVLLDPWASKR
jgi:2-desacetyl-2-hydroxyethyl bacteriochlorophyllide A dehydrogenase